MTPEEFNMELAGIEEIIGYPCPVDTKKFLWAKCKDKPVQYLRDRLTIYKVFWGEPNEMREKMKRHNNS